MSSEALSALWDVIVELDLFLKLYNNRKLRRFHKYLVKLYFKENEKVVDAICEELEAVYNSQK